jgi:thiol-disulfide isomerase/thioredoxin
VLALQLHTVQAQPRIIKFNIIDSLLHHNNSETVLVINFWATWCKPCVTELPYFEQLNKDYAASNVKVIFVSLDFKRQFESRLIPFVEKNNINAEVLLLDEPDYNSWIDKVDSSWSGAIPASAIITRNKKLFFEKEFTSYAELENIVKPLIQN